ncbi:hypothetical protein [Massilia sp. TS11]|uniref:hypothetical protein n=1 Tax=Massilia sp. TS11 TaxID=2908003 RepID=UPI001EDC47F2|nr:hypothetical protein [Massilia sp. TS11]MCG2585082.1 hypothetical protein [Massilia sp. TS11]
MNDDLFLQQISDGSLAPSHFNHAGHIRLARILVQRYPLDDAVARCCTLIAAYARGLGAHDKFHWTVTEALVRLLHAHGPAALEDARGLLARHYSAARLADAAGRTRFLAPDLLPLPA